MSKNYAVLIIDNEKAETKRILDIATGPYYMIGGGIYADVLGVDALRATNRGDGPEPLEVLSEREQEVLQLVTRGYTNKEMAQALIVSAETIKTHVTNILGKLQAKDRTHAAVIGVRRGLVSGE